MRKQAVVATLVALVIAVAVPAAFADSPSSITPANGNDFILPDGSVYQQNDDGTFSWIPNVATGNAMGLDWNNLQPVDALDGSVVAPVPVGPRPVERLVQPDRHHGIERRRAEGDPGQRLGLRARQRPGVAGQLRRHLLVDPGCRDR